MPNIIDILLNISNVLLGVMAYLVSLKCNVIADLPGGNDLITKNEIKVGKLVRLNWN